MKRPILAALVATTVGLAACPGGLPLDYGNAFPCDFSLPEGERDAPCESMHAGEWVCGADNLCRPFENEGHQEETPDYTLVAGGGQLVYPADFTGPVRAVTTDPGNPLRVLVAVADAGLYLVGESRTRVDPLSVTGVSGSAVDALGLVGNTPGDEALVAALTGSAVVTGVLRADAGAAVTDLDVVRTAGLGMQVGVTGLRTDARRTPLSLGAAPLALLLADGGAGDTTRTAPPPSPPPYVFLPIDGGAYFPGAPGDAVADLRVLHRSALERVELDGGAGFSPYVPVVFTRDAILYRERRGGGTESWVRLNAADDGVAAQSNSGLARHTPNGQLWAYVSRGVVVDVLSTWRVERANPPVMTRAWPDCAPCGRGRVVEAMPAAFGGALSVEVLCTGVAGVAAPKVLRVTGASTLVSTDPCEAETVDPPFQVNELSYAVDRATGHWVSLGGQHGQVWSGPTLSTALPLSLDRVPHDIATFGGQPAAMTELYVALPRPSDEGNVAIPMSSLLGTSLGTGRRPAAFVKDAEGWAVLDTGELLRIEAGAEGARASFGPSLEGPSGDPAQGPFTAASMGLADGGVRFIVAAFDNLYEHELAGTSALPGELQAEIPLLTPEPGFPIRSLALDTATPNRPDAGLRVRGYAATARGVHRFELGGSPERWSSRPVPLPAGELVEAWMNAKGSDLGRAGYRDGTVFTLPGGYPMAERLPEVNGQVPRVVDFANLNGWPVALTEQGLFLTRVKAGSATRMLEWVQVPLPPELEQRPVRFQHGRIEVLAQPLPDDHEDQVLYLFSDHGFVHRIASSRSR